MKKRSLVVLVLVVALVGCGEYQPIPGGPASPSGTDSTQSPPSPPAAKSGAVDCSDRNQVAVGGPVVDYVERRAMDNGGADIVRVAMNRGSDSFLGTQTLIAIPVREGVTLSPGTQVDATTSGAIEEGTENMLLVLPPCDVFQIDGVIH